MTLLYDSLKRTKPLFKTGWHSAALLGVSESIGPKSGEPVIKLDFANGDGRISLFLPKSKACIFVLNGIAGVAGIKTKKYRISQLVGETFLIQVKYNKIVKIKKLCIQETQYKTGTITAEKWKSGI